MPRTYVNDETCNPVIVIHTHLSSRAKSVKRSRDWREDEVPCHPGNCFAGHGQEELPMMVKPQGRLCFTTGIRLTSCFRSLHLQTTL